jgi:hypothetical protein
VPAWGYFDESDPAMAQREIDLAADHGVTGFIYDWYWYEDGPFLIDALEKGFLNAPRQRIKFALMWANHDWLDLFPAASGKQNKLVDGALSRAGFDRMVDHVVSKLMSHPSYLKLDGAPYFSIYELGTFIKGLGGLDAARDALESFRAKVRAQGHPDLHLNAVVWGISVLPSEVKLEHPSDVLSRLGFQSATTYAWVHHFDPSSAGFPRSSYARAAEANFAKWSEYQKTLPVPYHPNVSMGWDSTPRTKQGGSFEKLGYPWIAVLEGNTPEAFEDALVRARDFVKPAPPGQRVVTINAWNEWTEGSYLLPDAARGAPYLDAVGKVFGGR